MYVYGACLFLCCSDCVSVSGNVCCVVAVVENSVFGVLKYVVCLCRGYDRCCVFCLYCKAWNCRCSCMGSVSVSSCTCCMFVSFVHPVAVLHAAFCMTYSLLMLVKEARGDHTEEAYSRAGLITVLLVAMSASFCCCCLPSETYVRNGVTPIFRSFHRTASSNTSGWSRWNILMCFYISF